MSAPPTDAAPKRRRAHTVERLLDAALEVFAEVGFAGASVEDVCRRGGFTRGAFYSSFSTKDELFAALYARECERELGRIEAELAGIEQERDPVLAAVERYFATVRSDRTWVLVQAEYRLHAARNPEAAAALRGYAAEVESRLAELIARIAARAGLSLALPPEQLGRMFTALHDGFALAALSASEATAPPAPSLPELERRTLLLLLRTLTTP